MNAASSAHVLPQLTNVLAWRFHQSQQPEDNYVVPRRVHFIWYNSPCPTKFRANVLRCRELNPEYRVTLWTNCDQAPLPGVEILRFDREPLRLERIREIFREHLGTYGDLLRYALVYRFGGTYFDTDYEFYKPFDARFAHSFVCAEPHHWKNICAGAFGFPAGSRFLDYVLRCIPENLIVHAPTYAPEIAGPTFFTTCFVQYADPQIHNIPQCYVGGEDPTGTTPESEIVARHVAANSWGLQRHDYAAAYASVRRIYEPYAVIIPSYQRFEYCLRAVRSALNQTVPPAHVIVVDDASPDPRYAELPALFSDSRVVICRLHENSRVTWKADFAVGAARNHALAFLRRAGFSGWIAFLDDDDEWFPEKMETQLTAARSFSGYRLLCANATGRYPDGRITVPMLAPSGKVLVPPYYDVTDAMRPNPVLNLTAVLHTDIVQLIGDQQNVGAPEDYNYWLAACKHTRVLRVEQCLAYYCVDNYKHYQA